MLLYLGALGILYLSTVSEVLILYFFLPLSSFSY